MKNSTILSICLIALVSIIGSSCEKNTEEKVYTEVEYGILTIDPFINSITYTDASGKDVVTNDLTQFAGGSKKLSVSTKSFKARMEVQINNVTNNTKVYTIAILINGEPKAIKSIQCNPGAIAVGEIEFTVQ